MARGVYTESGLEWGSHQWVMWGQNSYRYQGVEEEGIKMVHQWDMFTHNRLVPGLSVPFAQTLEKVKAPGGDTIMDDALWLRVAGKHHDDLEMVTGDILAPVKARMTSGERAELDQQEDLAASVIGRYILGLDDPATLDSYIQMHAELRAKQTLRSQVVDVADKFCALGEKLHEIRCGNKMAVMMLKQSEEAFAKFARYPFWSAVANYPTLRFTSDFPSVMLAVIAASEPLRPNHITSPGRLKELMTKDFHRHLPICYVSWANVAYRTFSVHPEKFLFSGWAVELWSSGSLPRPRTTGSGIVLPR